MRQIVITSISTLAVDALVRKITKKGILEIMNDESKKLINGIKTGYTSDKEKYGRSEAEDNLGNNLLIAAATVGAFGAGLKLKSKADKKKGF